MSQQSQPQTPEKPQLKMKLLRRIFYFILVMFIFPVMLIPLRLTSGGDVEQSEYFNIALIGAMGIFIVLIAIVFFSIAPVVIEMFDARNREREQEDIGMFP